MKKLMKWGIFSLIGMLCLVACEDPVTIPDSDGTPPVLSFLATDTDGNILEVIPSGTKNIISLDSPNKEVGIVISASDSESGIKQIEIEKTVDYWCNNNWLVDNYPDITESYPSIENGNVVVTRSIRVSAHSSELNCENNTSLTRVEWSFFIDATNHLDETVREVLYVRSAE